MGLLRSPGPARIGDPQHAPPRAITGTSTLDAVRETGVIRVGYFEDSLPYAFMNRRGELVGFDVEMALQLARDLGVDAEMVRVDRSVLARGLDRSACDVLMSGVAVTADRALRVQFSSPYLDETVAFIVPDNLAGAFSDWDEHSAPGPAPHRRVE